MTAVGPRRTGDLQTAGGGASGVDPDAPWPGLRPYTEATSALFFGRDAEIAELAQRIEQKPLTVLFGSSGLGKTSLLNAGLVPRLRSAGAVPVVVRLLFDDGAPELATQVVDAVRDALAKALPDRPRVAAGVEPWLLLHDKELGFTDGQAPSIVLVFDQFEEVFTLGDRRPDDVRKFEATLAEIVENEMPDSVRQRLETDDDLDQRLDPRARPCKVLLALRDDFLHQLERLRGIMPSLMDNRFELRRLSGPQAHKAVVEPGRLDPSRPPLVTDETAADIVCFVANRPLGTALGEIDAVPPLLSLVCAELNEQRMGRGDPQISSEDLKGRAQTILAAWYERCFLSLPSAARHLVEDRLLTADGFRDSVAVATAEQFLADHGVVEPAPAAVIAELVKSRLLTAEERGGTRRIELTHDVLTQVAGESRSVRKERERAEQAERQRAEVERQRARQRRLTFAFAGLALAFAVGVALAVWQWRLAVEATRTAVNAEGEAKQAEAKARKSELAAVESRPDVEKALVRLYVEEGRREWLAARPRHAMVWLAEAYRRSPAMDPATRTMLGLVAKAAVDAPIFALEGHTAQVSSATFSPDGTRVVTASDDKTARLWDASTGRPLATLEGHSEQVKTATFSPDGTRVVTAAPYEAARVWDVHPETRPPSVISALVRCKLPRRLDPSTGALVDVAPDPSACPGPAAAGQPPP